MTANAPTLTPPARRVAALVNRAIENQEGRFSQKDIARRSGMSPPMLSMVRHGHTKLPLEYAIDLATLLEIDPIVLVRNALEATHSPKAIRAIYSTMWYPTSTNEAAIIRFLRMASRNSDPELTAELRIGIERAVSSSSHATLTF